MDVDLHRTEEVLCCGSVWGFAYSVCELAYFQLGPFSQDTYYTNRSGKFAGHHHTIRETDEGVLVDNNMLLDWLGFLEISNRVDLHAYVALDLCSHGDVRSPG